MPSHGRRCSRRLPSSNRWFKFHKRSQLFIPAHNETLSVAVRQKHSFGLGTSVAQLRRDWQSSPVFFTWERRTTSSVIHDAGAVALVTVGKPHCCLVFLLFLEELVLVGAPAIWV